MKKGNMKIKPIPDNDSNFELVILKTGSNGVSETPHCKIHGAMNKVSYFEEDGGGYWRCNVTSETTCRAGCWQYTV